MKNQKDVSVRIQKKTKTKQKTPHHNQTYTQKHRITKKKIRSKVMVSVIFFGLA